MIPRDEGATMRVGTTVLSPLCRARTFPAGAPTGPGTGSRAAIAARAGLLLGLALPAAAAAQGVLGHVRDAETGEPVAAAAVALVDSAGTRLATAPTDSAGAFGLPVYAAGTYGLVVSHVAYRETRTRTVEIDRDEVVQVDIRLSRLDFTLDPLVVTARRRAQVSYLTDYYERADRNETLGRGRILRRKDLEPLEGLAVADVLARHPGTGRFTDPLWGSSCQPATYWNGLRVPVGDIPVASVEGIEVYRRREVPAEYAGDLEARACGVVLVWNRPIRPGEARPNTLGRLALAAGAVVLFVFLAR
jgi:hypothetical protein